MSRNSLCDIIYVGHPYTEHISQHCPFCNTPSEKSDGCNHIICQMPSCRREWCYICETAWGFECMKRHWGTEELPLIATSDDTPI